MIRTRYLVAYDIRDSRRLRDVHKVCKMFGYPLQYSVFICDLDEGEKVSMEITLGDVLNHREDSVVIVDLGEPGGRGKECFEFLGVRSPSTLPQSGPVIL